MVVEPTDQRRFLIVGGGQPSRRAPVRGHQMDPVAEGPGGRVVAREIGHPPPVRRKRHPVLRGAGRHQRTNPTGFDVDHRDVVLDPVVDVRRRSVGEGDRPAIGGPVEAVAGDRLDHGEADVHGRRRQGPRPARRGTGVDRDQVQPAQREPLAHHPPVAPFLPSPALLLRLRVDHQEGDSPSVGRPFEEGDPAGLLGQRLGLAPLGRNPPQIGPAGAGREEGDRRSVRRPCRRERGLLAGRELAGGSGAVGGCQVDLLEDLTLVARRLGQPDLKDHPSPVGGHLRATDQLDPQPGLGGPLGWLTGRRRHRRQGQPRAHRAGQEMVNGRRPYGALRRNFLSILGPTSALYRLPS